ncbi:hypothetical protein FXO38_02400 [Capsicum annuum]|nr:hypothetical protein FXO37_33070 [Capsicum annuum]KAF3680246.1 hypothetical protein FXO38_02400 [Capsicum annuum]
MDFRAFDAGTASAKQEARLLFQGVAQFVNALQVWNSLTQTSKCQQHFDVYKECKKKEFTSANFCVSDLSWKQEGVRDTVGFRLVTTVLMLLMSENCLYSDRILLSSS